jgi:hypothetical protein
VIARCRCPAKDKENPDQPEALPTPVPREERRGSKVNMPKIEFKRGIITHSNQVAEESGGIVRIHCEAEFTKKIADILKIDGPEDWPEACKGYKLDLDDIPIKEVQFDPFDQSMRSLKFTIAASMMGAFTVKEVTRDDDTRKIINFVIKSSVIETAKAVTDWTFTSGTAECNIDVSYPTQKELKIMEIEKEKQMALTGGGVEE